MNFETHFPMCFLGRVNLRLNWEFNSSSGTNSKGYYKLYITNPQVPISSPKYWVHCPFTHSSWFSTLFLCIGWPDFNPLLVPSTLTSTFSLAYGIFPFIFIPLGFSLYTTNFSLLAFFQQAKKNCQLYLFLVSAIWYVPPFLSFSHLICKLCIFYLNTDIVTDVTEAQYSYTFIIVVYKCIGRTSYDFRLKHHNKTRDLPTETWLTYYLRYVATRLIKNLQNVRYLI